MKPIRLILGALLTFLVASCSNIDGLILRITNTAPESFQVMLADVTSAAGFVGPGSNCSFLRPSPGTYCTEMPSDGSHPTLVMYTFLNDETYQLVVLPSGINTSPSPEQRSLAYSILRDLRHMGADLSLVRASRGWRLPDDLNRELKGGANDA
jgi:hypothetical protein